MANAILAAILSLIIPGLGQVYAGDIQKGAIFFAVFLVLLLLFWFVLISFIGVNFLNIILAIYAAYDAYKMASE